jgi:drug/metabolite transporter (DMT)-like permease
MCTTAAAARSAAALETEAAAGSSSTTADQSQLLAAPKSPKSLALGLALALGSQLGWGCYPVLARALQVQPPKLTLLELMVVLNVLCAAELLVFTSLRRAYASLRRLCGATAQPKRAAARPAMSRWRAARILFFFAFVILARAVTNLASAAYAPAHWIVMLNLSTPIWTACIGRLYFREPLPPGTLAALAVGIGGSAIAIFGGVRRRGGDDGGDESGHEASPYLALGIGLALVSAFSLSVYQHCVRRTKGIISEGAVLCLNYAVVLVPAVALQAATAGGSALLSSVEALDVRQWALLFAFSLGVYLGANLAQQLAIRQLGPALVSSLMPSRLLSSVAGSYLLLGEGITSAIEGVGLLVVALSSAGYLGRQVLARRAAG